MKNFNMLFLSVFFVAAIALNVTAQSAPQHRLSPVVIEHKTIGDTYLKIVYGQPYKRDRVVFGELVPFNQVWRAGANEATEMIITGDIMFGGEHLNAGIYSLFVIPRPESWTIIVSNQLGQWGAYRYDEAQDELRVDVPVETLDEISEALTISFDEDGTTLNFRWDRTAVSVPISVH